MKNAAPALLPALLLALLLASLMLLTGCTSYELTGEVLHAVTGVGVPGVTITMGLNSTVTDANGHWRLLVSKQAIELAGTSVDVVPAKQGWRFTPPYKKVMAAGDISFVAQPPLFRLAYWSQRQSAIMLVNGDGSAGRLFAAASTASNLVWSPSGDKIAWRGGSGTSAGIYVADLSSSRAVTSSGVTISATARCIRQDAQAYPSAWSPDSTTLAYQSRRDGDWEVYLYGSDGSDTRLTNNTSDDHSPVWSPDGKHIAFVSSRDGRYEIYLMSADGRTQTRLTKSSGAAWNLRPVWSPDGSRIAYYSDKTGNTEVYTINADGTGEVNLTRSNARDEFPVWSPSGSHIAFVSNRSGNDDIWIMAADGGELVNLTKNSAADDQPAWSPDGSRIAFVSNRVGNPEIYVMQVNGAALTRLTINNANDSEPVWSSQVP